MRLLNKYLLLGGLSLLTYQLQAQNILHAQSGGSIVVQNNADLFVQGNVTLDAGSSLTNQGRIWVNNNTLTGLANWLDQTTVAYPYGSGITYFNSTGTQTVSSPNRFGTIRVQNAGLYQLSNIIADNWFLVTGIVHTGAFRSEAVSTAEYAVDASSWNPNFSLSWFNGTLRRHIQPTVINRYIFPVGNSTRVNRAELNNLLMEPINASYIDATFLPKPGTDAGLFLTGEGLVYTTINDGGVWNLQPDVASLTGSFDLNLHFDGFTGLINNLYGILERPIASINGADWIIPVGSNLPAINQNGRMVANGYARRRRVNILGQFGIGTSAVIALPLTLLDFKATRRNAQQVDIQWQTSNEETNGLFHIERKTSKESTFSTVGTVKATYDGSGHKAYTLTDPNTDTGISWYRIKMVSQSGNITYSSIRMVKGESIDGTVTIAPNPNRGSFTILAKGTKATQAFLLDAKGSLVRKLTIQEGLPIYVSGLSAGTYFLSIPDFFEGGVALREKIIVLHH